MKKDIIKKIVNYFAPYWKNCLVLFILIFIINLASLATPYILKIIIDTVLPNKDFDKLIRILLLLVAIYVIRIGLAFWFDILYTGITQKVISDMRTNIMYTVFEKPLSFFQQKQIGETIFILSNDVNNIQFSLSYLINDTLNNLILIGSLIGIMFSINVELTLISLASIPLMVIFITKLSPLIHSKFKKVQESETKLFNHFSDQLKNIKLIKTFQTNQFEKNRILELQQQIIDLQISNSKTNSLNKNVITFIVACIPVVILAFGGKEVMDNNLTIGGLIAYIQYVNRLLPPISSITNGYGTVIKSFVSMERINSFLKDGDKKETSKIGQNVIINTIEKIVLKNIYFNYRGKMVLDNLNLSLLAGKTYLISGESGSGKSTILNLICNIIQPDSGCLMINGSIPYSEVKDLNKSICLVEKENQIFSDTIFNNINYGAFVEDEIMVKNALEKVNLFSEIMSTAKGMQTELNSTMNILSEGQKQRISLARMFLKHYSVIIIDEATASLDIRNERQILKRLREDNPQAIIVIVSHRFSFDDLCDDVYEFKNGILLSKQKMT